MLLYILFRKRNMGSLQCKRNQGKRIKPAKTGHLNVNIDDFLMNLAGDNIFKLILTFF